MQFTRLRYPQWVRCIFLFACCLTLACGAARADWVNLGGAEVAPNIVEFHIEDDGVRVVLEVYVGDIDRFTDLVPSEWLQGADFSIAPDAERLEKFAREGISILGDDGAPLRVERLIVDRRTRENRASPLAGSTDPFSGRTLPSPPEDPRVLYVELFYSFDGKRPNSLSFTPPLTADGNAAASIGTIVFHRAVPVIDFRFLSAAATLTLDWDDPWYSAFDNPNMTRHHKYPRMAYLYAEPYEIRHEALVRVRDAANLVGMSVDDETLSAEAAQELATEAAARIGAMSSVSIEGESVDADFDRFAFMRIGIRGLEFLAPGEDVNVDADILGLIWSAPTDGLPTDAALEWTWFDDTTPLVNGYTVDAAGPFLSPLTADDPIMVWKNHFKKSPYPTVEAVAVTQREGTHWAMYALVAIALLAAGLAVVLLLRGRAHRGFAAGCAVVAVAAVVAIPIVASRLSARVPVLAQDQVTSLTTDLLNNVYRAFDFRLEDQVYDRLALTLDGDILEQVYLDQRNALRVERAGGADARVKDLEVTQVEQLDPEQSGTLRLKVNWQVVGIVGHWGHQHGRANAYEAELTLKPVDGDWKILGFDMLSQERLS